MSQWISSWIFGIIKIQISMVITAMSNGNLLSPFVIYIYGMIGKETLVVLIYGNYLFSVNTASGVMT